MGYSPPGRAKIGHLSRQKIGLMAVSAGGILAYNRQRWRMTPARRPNAERDGVRVKKWMICLLSLLLLLVAGSVQAQPERQASLGLGTDLLDPDVPRFEPSSCPIDVPAEPQVECGYLVVPEDYDEPGGARIRLPVAIIRSPNPNPAPAALVVAKGSNRLALTSGGIPGPLSVTWIATQSSDSAMVTAICRTSAALTASRAL